MSGMAAGGPRPLVEREAETATIDAAIASVVAGSGRVVVVEGGIGTGKTALLGVAQWAARAAGLTVAAATGNALEQGFEYGVVLQAFEPFVLGAGGDALLDGQAGLAGPLFGRDAGRALIGDPAHSIRHGLHWLIRNLTNRSPLLFTIDNAQWADQASLRLLPYVIERLSRLPLLLLLTLTPGSNRTMLSQTVGHPAARVLQLEPLTARGIRQLVERYFHQDPDEAFAKELLRLTAGNPRMVEEYLHALDVEGSRPTEAAVPHLREIVPPRLARSVAATFGRLPGPAAELAAALAVVGEAPSVALGALAPTAAPDLAAALGSLRQAGLVAAGEPVRFLQPVLQRATYTAIPVHVRSELHRTAARAVVTTSRDWRAAARHLLATAPAGDEWCAATLWAGATAALQDGEPGEAAVLLRRAVLEPAPEDVRGELLFDLGSAELSMGDADGVDRIDEAASTMRDRVRRALALHDVARTLHMLGRPTEAAAACDSAIAVAPPDQADLVARLRAMRLRIDRHRSRIDLTAAPGPVDLEQARTLPPDATVAEAAEAAFEAAISGASAELVRDRVAVAVSRGGLLDTAEPDELAVYSAGFAAIVADDIEGARRIAAATTARATHRGSALGAVASSALAASVHYLEGDLASAIERAEWVLRIGQPWALYRDATAALLIRALIDRGDLGRAATVRAAVEAASPDPTLGTAGLEDAFGLLSLELGDAQAALASFRRAGTIVATITGRADSSFLPWRAGEAIALHRIGNEAEARAVAFGEVEVARSFGAPRSIAVALRVAALIDRAQRLELLQEAHGLLAGSPARLDRARVAADLGAALRRSGQRAAEEVLAEAHSLAVECGATPLAARVESELAELRGRRDAGRRQASPTSLTQTEAAIAELAAAGKTNREIASERYVSIKAVEWHLRNVYGKLGITSRRELPQALEQAQTDPDE